MWPDAGAPIVNRSRRWPSGRAATIPGPMGLLHDELERQQQTAAAQPTGGSPARRAFYRDVLRRGSEPALDPQVDFRGLDVLCPNPGIDDLAEEIDMRIQRKDAARVERLDFAELIETNASIATLAA